MRFMVSLGFYLNRPLGSGVLACKTPRYGVVMPLIPSIPCRSAGVVEGLEVTLVVQGIAERKGTFPEHWKCHHSVSFLLFSIELFEHSTSIYTGVNMDGANFSTCAICRPLGGWDVLRHLEVPNTCG